MSQSIKSIVKPLFQLLPKGVKSIYYRMRERQANDQVWLDWQRNGKPLPPPHIVKQRTIEAHQKESGFSVLVETGTFLGDMVEAERRNFDKIYSIELSEVLWEKAVERFRVHKKIQILKGDSGMVLRSLVPQIKTPAIFWLDGHYSEGMTARGEKDCPIIEELAAIFLSDLNHILLIDDARCFTGEGHYPSVRELSELITSKRPSARIHVEDDIIRVKLQS